MIFGLFGTALGKGSAGVKESGQTAAVMEPPVASPPASQTAAASEQATGKTAPSGAGGVAQADGTQPPAAKACPHCGSTEPWGVSSWCPSCFYHPRLGRTVDTPPLPDPEVRQFLPGHVAQPESYAAVLKSIPLWVHVWWIGVAACFALSVYATVKLPKFGYERAVWTLAQASIGLLAAAAAHVMTFLWAIPNMEKHGPFDLLMKPFDFWRYAIRKLPSGAWRLWMISWGLTAGLSAIVLIGGIRYSSVFEIKSKKKNSWIQTSQVVPETRSAIYAANG